MNIIRICKEVLFLIRPQLVGASCVHITEENKFNFNGDWSELPPKTITWIRTYSLKELMMIIDFSEDVLVFLSECQPFKIIRWYSHTTNTRLDVTKTIWFLDSSDAIKFKLMFGGNGSLD
jgi:hypothetical protein